MKAIFGIDNDGKYLYAFNLFSRLKFEQPSAELIHVEPIPALGGAGNMPYTYAQYPLLEETMRKVSEELLARAEGELPLHADHKSSMYLEGNTSYELIRRADEIHADLIAIGSTNKSMLGALFLGGVGRGLTIGAHHSLLIAKHEHDAVGPLTALFATDCSPYADDCLRMLVRMHPAGITKFVLLTAVNEFIDGVPTKEISDHMESLAEHLREEGLCVDVHIVEAGIVAAIDVAMQTTKADLLIMGAQGHGVVERMTIGSVSLQEVLTRPHSILLLRKAQTS